MQVTSRIRSFGPGPASYSSINQTGELGTLLPKCSQLLSVYDLLRTISRCLGRTLSLGFLLLAVPIGTVGAIIVLLVLQFAGKRASGFEHHFGTHEH